MLELELELELELDVECELEVDDDVDVVVLGVVKAVVKTIDLLDEVEVVDVGLIAEDKRLE